MGIKYRKLVASRRADTGQNPGVMTGMASSDIVD